MPSTFYDFDWDPKKARANLKKHGVSFRLATSVFRDPLMLTISMTYTASMRSGG